MDQRWTFMQKLINLQEVFFFILKPRTLTIWRPLPPPICVHKGTGALSGHLCNLNLCLNVILTLIYIFLSKPYGIKPIDHYNYMRLLGAELLPCVTSRGQQTADICDPPAAASPHFKRTLVGFRLEQNSCEKVYVVKKKSQ